MLAVQRGQLTGGAAFIDAKLQHRIEYRKQGRPKGSNSTKSGDRPEVSPLKARGEQREWIYPSFD